MKIEIADCMKVAKDLVEMMKKIDGCDPRDTSQLSVRINPIMLEDNNGTERPGIQVLNTENSSTVSYMVVGGHPRCFTIEYMMLTLAEHESEEEDFPSNFLDLDRDGMALFSLHVFNFLGFGVKPTVPGGEGD